MPRWFRRHDRERDGCRLTAHRYAGLAPKRFRYAEVVAQPVGGVDDVGSGRCGRAEICPQLRRQAHQLVGAQPHDGPGIGTVWLRV
jgi:hypothetical protein